MRKQRFAVISAGDQAAIRAPAHFPAEERDAFDKVRVRGLRKTYGPVVALEGADLDVKNGEFLTLLGPSGSGKTTLLMLVAGLVSPDEGEVWIGGKISTYAPPNRRDIGMVFQNYALFPHLTVFENIAFPLRMRRYPESKIQAEVERALETIRLPGVGGRLPRQLSGGQQQRIALARCIVYRPSVILMDEPLGALDKKLREQMQREIKRLHTELRTTVLYVTHDQEEALALSDRICLMNEARIEQIGTPDELYFRPATIFAGNFLGESNLINAAVISQDGARVRLQGPCGLVFTAVCQRPVSVGQSLTLMVRPESIRLLTNGERAANEIPSILADVVLAGQTTRYHGRYSEGQEVEISAAALTQPGLQPLPGSRVIFGWPAEAGVLLDPATAHGAAR